MLWQENARLSKQLEGRAPSAKTARKKAPEPPAEDEASPVDVETSGEEASEEDAKENLGSGGRIERQSAEELTEGARQNRLRRLCERKPSGKLLVPQSVHDQYIQGGPGREALMELLSEANYNKEPHLASLPCLPFLAGCL